jgi:hypothetical protein
MSDSLLFVVAACFFAGLSAALTYALVSALMAVGVPMLIAAVVVGGGMATLATLAVTA